MNGSVFAIDSRFIFEMSPISWTARRSPRVICSSVLGRLRPTQVVAKYRPLVDQEQRRLDEVVRHRLQEMRHHCDTLETRLRLLAPEKVLSRGYSITMDAESGASRSASGDAAGFAPTRRGRSDAYGRYANQNASAPTATVRSTPAIPASSRRSRRGGAPTA